MGVIIRLADGSALEGMSIVGTRCSHSFQPGVVLAALRTGVVVAVGDGTLRLSSLCWRP
jgi:hypothetical protein